MTKENKISLVIFTLFLVYGIQGFFSLKAFIIPFFLNKLFYLAAAIIFYVIWFVKKQSEKKYENQLESNESKTTSSLPLLLLILMSAAWVAGDPYSTEFIAYTFNGYEAASIFENYYVILVGLIVFTLCWSFFAFKILSYLNDNWKKIVLVLFYIASLFMFFIADSFWQKLFFPISAIALAFIISKKENKTLETFSAWLNLVALLEGLTFFIPD